MNQFDQSELRFQQHYSLTLANTDLSTQVHPNPLHFYITKLQRGKEVAQDVNADILLRSINKQIQNVFHSRGQAQTRSDQWQIGISE